MIVAGYQLRNDPFALRILVDHVIQLAIHAGSRQQFGFIEARLSVYPVAGVEHSLDADALEMVISRFEHIQARMLVTEMVVGNEAYAMLPLSALALHRMYARIKIDARR